MKKVMLGGLVLALAGGWTPQAWGGESACDPTPVPGLERAAPCQRGTIEKAAVYVDDVLVDVLEYERVGDQAISGGDMLLNLASDGNLYFSTKDEAHVSLRAAGRSATNFFWPNRVIPFRFNANLTAASRTSIQNAINHVQQNTNLTFVTRTTEANFVEFFFQSNTCSSFVGRIGGMQRITIDPAGCGFGGIVHEIAHAAGLWHEQSRADRDNHVIVNWANIQAGRENNFRTYVEEFQNGADYGSFDFGSIMLYSSNAFSANGLPTLTRLDGSTWTAQRTALSTGDKFALNCRMYPRAPVVSVYVGGNYNGSTSVYASASVFSRCGGLTYSWTYGGMANSFSYSGQSAYASYNPPGCQGGNVNFFYVTVTDAAGLSTQASAGTTSCL